jgi:hypothetical protein
MDQLGHGRAPVSMSCEIFSIGIPLSELQGYEAVA